MTSHLPDRLFMRRCDDDHCMNMDVISTIDRGARHTGSFDDEDDTVAITFHQLRPQVGMWDHDEEAVGVRLVECYNALTGVPDPAQYRTLADAAVRLAEIYTEKYTPGMTREQAIDHDVRLSAAGRKYAALKSAAAKGGEGVAK